MIDILLLTGYTGLAIGVGFTGGWSVGRLQSRRQIAALQRSVELHKASARGWRLRAGE